MNLYYYSLQISKVLNQNNSIIVYFNEIKEAKRHIFINPQEIVDLKSDNQGKVNKFNALQTSVLSGTNIVSKIVNKVRPSEIYRSINSLILDLNSVDHSYNDENGLIIDLKKLVEIHTDAYSEKTSRYVLMFIEICERVAISINDIRERSDYIIKSFDESSKPFPESYFKLSIKTDQDIPLLEDFSSVLKNIDDLYNFICLIYKIDNKTNKLMINHISTGSWLTELTGVEPVIKCIESLIKSFGNFIRDFVTGKISYEKFENEFKKNMLALELIEKAREVGISNPEIGLIKGFKPLILNFKTDTTYLEINNEEVLNLQEHEKITILERKSKRIEIVEQVKQLTELKTENEDE